MIIYTYNKGRVQQSDWSKYSNGTQCYIVSHVVNEIHFVGRYGGGGVKCFRLRVGCGAFGTGSGVS